MSVCELVAMMVPALFFAATILECGLAPLEHGLVCGLAHVGLGPRQCAATPLLPFAAPVGMELVTGTPRLGSCLRGCYGGQGLHLGHPHGVRVECCNGASRCGSHPHEQWRRFCGSLSLFVLGRCGDYMQQLRLWVLLW